MIDPMAELRVFAPPGGPRKSRAGRPKSLVVAARGTQRDLLVALQEKLARTIGPPGGAKTRSSAIGSIIGRTWPGNGLRQSCP